MSTTDAVRQKVEDLVLTALAANHPGVPMSVVNVKFEEPKNAPWVHLAFAPGKSARKNIGTTRTWRHMGVVVVNIMTPADTGTKTSDAIRDTIFNALADRNFALGVDGYLTLCFAEKRNRGILNGWYTANVQVEYYQDVTATD